MKKNFKKVAMTSDNIENDNLQKLRTVFPQFVKDGSIDFDALQAFFKKEGILAGTEKYGLSWAGKSKAFGDISRTATGTLTPQLDESKNWDTTENIFIEGENLEVLKLLQKKYANPGKIRMCYIDPPYNTGKDFIYKDNFSQNISDYYEQTEQTKDGIKLTSNPESNGRYHSDWLTMMYPRLFLARNLLTDDGVIFVSIDGNEVANLRMIMDEIFGEENLLSIHHIQVRYGNKSLNERKDFQELIEYVLIYAKDKNYAKFKKPTEEYPVEKFNLEIKHDSKPSKTVEENGRKVDIWEPGSFTIKKVESAIDKFKETWISGSILTGTGHGTMYLNVIDKRRSEDGNGCLYRIHGIGEDGLGYRYYTNPKNENADRGKMYTKIPLTVIEELKNGTANKENPIINFYDYSGDFGNIRHEGDMPFNGGKKPIKMISQFMNYIEEKDYIVLDFFAGSGSTAHACMQLNSEDDGKRKYILVQLPEQINEDDRVLYDIATKELKKSPTITTIARERIRRAGNKIEEIIENEMTNRRGTIAVGIADEDELEIRKVPDIGFKALSLSSSNYRRWNTLTEEDDEKTLIKQAKLFLEKPLVDGYDEESVVYEIILKEGFDLNSFVQAPKKAQKYLPLWVVVDKGERSRKMTITFAKKVTKEDIAKTGIGETDNETFVCFDSALDDTIKVNIMRNLTVKTI